MKVTVIIHEAEEGGFWAEVPSIPGCATQGETMEELNKNLREAIDGCASVSADERLAVLRTAIDEGDVFACVRETLSLAPTSR